MASASLSSDSAPDFAIAAYFNADLSIRNTPSFVASLARIASFRSESTRCCSVICENYLTRGHLSMQSRCAKKRRKDGYTLVRHFVQNLMGVDLFREFFGVRCVFASFSLSL